MLGQNLVQHAVDAREFMLEPLEVNSGQGFLGREGELAEECVLENTRPVVPQT